MILNRDILEQYLDGELPASEQARVQAALKDAPNADLLARLQSQRALRAAALQSYIPSDASTATATLLAALHNDAHPAPIARIGPAWLPRLASLAAVLAIAAGSFYLGHVTATPGTPPTGNGNGIASTNPATPVDGTYVVTIQRSDGTVLTREFKTLDEARSYAQTLAQQADDSTTALASGVL